MKDSIKNRKKHLIALFLSAMMLSSVAAFAACGDDSTDSSDSSVEEEVVLEDKDDGLVKNAGFETYDEKNVFNTSVTGWTRSTTSASSGSGLSSKAASGIIDLSVDGWNKLTGSTHVATDAEDAKANWANMTVRDKLNFYEKWESENEGKKIADELDFYESINIDLGDIPDIERFDTHHKEGDEGYGEDTKVLMIHNQNPEVDPNDASNKTIGTGQKFTSSSTVTVKAGTSAKFSVWVRTQDLTCATTGGGTQEAVGKGAYISVTHSVGGTSLDAYRVENINVNEWTQYEFLLKGSSYADTTFSLVLGLGQGGGSYRGEYVNGYAFFDDIKCEIITNESYDDYFADSGIATGEVVKFEHEGKDKIVDTYKYPDRKYFAMDFYGTFSNAVDYLSDVKTEATKSEETGSAKTIYTSLKDDPALSETVKVAPWLGEGFDGSKDVTQVFATADDIKNANGVAEEKKATLQSVYNKYLKEDTRFANEPTLLLLSINGAAYEATPQQAGADYAFTVSDYLAVSFFVKTSAMHGYTGAGITLTDENDNETAFTAIDTTTLTPVEVDGKDVNEGWQQYVFFVENAKEDDASTATFTLSFNFGPTDIAEGTSKDSYLNGFAAFTNFQTYQMSRDEFDSAQDGSFAKVVSITDDDANKEGSNFDSAVATPSDAIEKGFADAQNYKGVYWNSAYLTGTGSDEINTYDYAGLVNKKYFTEGDTAKGIPAYFNTSTNWINSIANGETDATTVWNNVFGADSTQPLLIWNDASMLNNAYGFIGKSTSVAANNYAVVSVRVKGSVGAKAYVRLVDVNDSSYEGVITAYNKPLSIGGNLTYWYDDKGNICTGDPSEKATMVAFNLQSNGLYKVNKNCTDLYEALKAEGKENAYFANLNAYVDPLTGELPKANLTVAKNGASHDYNDKWNNEGMTGIAYYYDNGVYYADSAKTIAVNNVADINAELLKPRYLAESAATRVLEQELTFADNEWTTVTFYLHTGDSAKNYRLELWSGDKAGNGNAAGQYVVFDYNNPGEAQSNFTKYLDDDDFVKAGEQKLESVFSYYDTASFLRYNSDLDEKETGNLYEYTASANTEGIAFLKHKSENGYAYTFFADYQYTEKVVTASAVEEEAEEEETEEEEDSDTNVWLLVSSLSVAGVLLIAIASIVIQKAVKASKKRKAHAVPKPKKVKKSKKSDK